MCSLIHCFSFFLSARLQNENRRTDNKASLRPGYNIEVSTSRLHPLVFDCLFCLCHSMLEACLKECDYQGAYRLLIHTTGFCTTNNETTCSQRGACASRAPSFGMFFHDFWFNFFAFSRCHQDNPNFG